MYDEKFIIIIKTHMYNVFNLMVFICLYIEFFLQFKETNLMAIIEEQKFESLRPFYVKKMKERRTCCCIYNVEIDQLQFSLNNMRGTSELHGIKKCNCTCPYACLRNVNHFSCNVISSIYPRIIFATLL